MADKRVRMGSGIRPRKSKAPESQTDERLAPRRPDHVIEAPDVAPDDTKSNRLASIFQKAAGSSIGSNSDPNSDGLAIPPPIPKSEKKLVPPPISKGPKIERSDPLISMSDDFGSSGDDTALSEVPSIEGIDKTTGNYLLTLGYPGSGKTVLQSFIYYYIATDGAYSGSLEKHRKGAQPSHLTQTLLNKWVKDWSDRKLPESTRESVDAIREIRLRLTPKINTSKSFNFSFVEVSGELIKSVVPTEVQAGSIVETMHSFLTAPKSKKMIVYVFDHNEDSNNDELFSSLIQYLENAMRGKLDKSYSLMIIVPNPNLVLQRISSDERYGRKYSNINELTPAALRHYLRVKAPQLVTTFRYWKKSKKGIYKFHIGEASENATGDQILESFDFKDSGRIVDFCYQQFHGTKLKEGWFTRLTKVIRD
jgi:hypothetical protein